MMAIMRLTGPRTAPVNTQQVNQTQQSSQKNSRFTVKLKSAVSDIFKSFRPSNAHKAVGISNAHKQVAHTKNDPRTPLFVNALVKNGIEKVNDPTMREAILGSHKHEKPSILKSPKYGAGQGKPHTPEVDNGNVKTANAVWQANNKTDSSHDNRTKKISFAPMENAPERLRHQSDNAPQRLKGKRYAIPEWKKNAHANQTAVFKAEKLRADSGKGSSEPLQNFFDDKGRPKESLLKSLVGRIEDRFL